MTPVLPGYGDRLADGWLVVLVRADPDLPGDDLNYCWHEATWRMGVETEGWWTVMLVRSQPNGGFEQRLFVHRPARGWEEAEVNGEYVREWVDSDYTEKPYIMKPAGVLPWEATNA